MVPSDSDELDRVAIGVRNNASTPATVKIKDVTGGEEPFWLGVGHVLTVSVMQVFATGTSSGASSQVAFDQ